MTAKSLQFKRFVVAPNESVLFPSIVTTLFPRLSPPARRAFRVCLVVILVVLLVLAVIRVPAALISVGALGVPLLFVLYLRESAAFHEIPRHLLALSAALGAVLGTAGMLLTGRLVAESYDVSMLAGMAMNRYLRPGIGIPVAAAILKLVPAAVARMLSRPPRKVLDGLAIGALGALAFGAAATLTRLAPQFATGTIARDRSLAGLIVEALISGVTVPLTAAASGATVGVALWFTPATSGRRGGRVALAVLAVIVIVIFVGGALVDTAGLSQSRVLAVHVALTIVAIVVTRLALQTALLHGKDPAADLTPMRPRPPTPLSGLLTRWTTGNALAAVALVGLSLMVTVKPQQFRCPPDCGRPPVGIPVTALPRYSPPDGAFSVAYPAPGTAYHVSVGPDGVTAKLTVGDGGLLRLFAEPARGRDPRRIAIDLLQQKFPDARIAYEIPNAMVGYQPGYGLAADRWPQSSTGSYLRVRILALVAVKNDLALVAAALGPYHEFGPSFGPGLPSGASLQIAQDMGKYVNSFRWNGDPLD